VGPIEDLISALRATCAGLPDKRRGKNSRYVMADIGMAAFSPGGLNNQVQHLPGRVSQWETTMSI
jgi:hypothetical protein